MGLPRISVSRKASPKRFLRSCKGKALGATEAGVTVWVAFSLSISLLTQPAVWKSSFFTTGFLFLSPFFFPLGFLPEGAGLAVGHVAGSNSCLFAPGCWYTGAAFCSEGLLLFAFISFSSSFKRSKPCALSSNTFFKKSNFVPLPLVYSVKPARS